MPTKHSKAYKFCSTVDAGPRKRFVKSCRNVLLSYGFKLLVWFLSKNLSFCFAVFYALLLTGRTRIWDVVFAVKGHNVIRGFRDGSLFDFKLDKYIFR